MISLFFLILATICNAIMDICSHKFEKSIFYKDGNIQWNRWWNAADSWKNKYKYRNPRYGRRKLSWDTRVNFPVQLTDAWHFFKMWMIIFISIAISILLAKDFPISNDYFINILLWVLINGTCWNSIFSLFYNKVLRHGRGDTKI